jgi:hypothetical protein
MALLVGLPESALVDGSGGFPCRHRPTMVLHAHISPAGEQQARWNFRDKSHDMIVFIPSPTTQETNIQSLRTRK